MTRLFAFARSIAHKYGIDLENLPEDYEPQGLEEEIELRHGPKPSIERLLKVLNEHGIRGHAFRHGIYVVDSSGEKKIIPATLQAVMSYLGY